jgi:uncharacterized protein YdeI (YjbR/CyaY-like superfamily)
MATKDKRIDAYIAKSADFAKPILDHFRKLVHKTCPDVEEAWKWSFPHFDYKGQPLCSMASFKQHAVIGFWKASLMKDNKKLMDNAKSEVAMGHMGKLTSLKDLPKDSLLIKYIKEGIKLNDEGIKVSPKKKPQLPLKEPAYFLNALKKNTKALETYKNFSYSCKREYLTWGTEAKTEVTRDSRLKQAVEWMSEGKIRNWKYAK